MNHLRASDYEQAVAAAYLYDAIFCQLNHLVQILCRKLRTI